MRDLRSEVEAEFAEAQRLPLDLIEAAMEGRRARVIQMLERPQRARAAYQARHAKSGRCRSCPNPVVEGLQTCEVHRLKNLERQRRLRHERRATR
jgi:hypothetical protein